jgi:AcrR family transcriptional regulator
MPKVVAEYKTQARERIVSAASAVFRRQGFRATTMEDIAHEIGVSKGAIYLYFRTKIELLGAIQARSRENVLAQWQRLLEEGDVAEGIVRPLDQVFRGDVSSAVWHELMVASSSDPELRDVFKKDSREDQLVFERFLGKLQARGRIPKDRDIHVLAHTILLLLRGAVAEFMTEGRPAAARKELIRSLRFALGTKAS